MSWLSGTSWGGGELPGDKCLRAAALPATEGPTEAQSPQIPNPEQKAGQGAWQPGQRRSLLEQLGKIMGCV